MANALYPITAKAFMDGSIDLLTDDIKVLLVDTDTYTYSDAHDFHADVSGITSTSANLASKTTTAGVFDADNAVFSSVSGAVSEALIVYKDSGVSATSPLIAYIDTGVTGLPVTPDGNNITVAWNASGIFRFKLP